MFFVFLKLGEFVEFLRLFCSWSGMDIEMMWHCSQETAIDGNGMESRKTAMEENEKECS